MCRIFRWVSEAMNFKDIVVSEVQQLSGSLYNKGYFLQRIFMYVFVINVYDKFKEISFRFGVFMLNLLIEFVIVKDIFCIFCLEFNSFCILQLVTLVDDKLIFFNFWYFGFLLFLYKLFILVFVRRVYDFIRNIVSLGYDVLSKFNILFV